MDDLRPQGSRSALIVALAAAVLGAGCAGATPSIGEGVVPEAAAPREPPTAALLDAHATLLRLEDRRDADVPALLALAADGSAAVRARTALALGRVRGAVAADLLPRLLADGDSVVAASAAFALGILGDSAHAGVVADRLQQALDLSETTVADEAAYALGQMGGAVAGRALTRILEGGPGAGLDPAVARSALIALWRAASPVPPELIAPWLASEDPEIRWRAAYALTRPARAEGLPLLRPLLADPDPRVRATALRGINGEMAGGNDPTLVSEVAALLADTAYPVAINAAGTLASFPTPAAVAALTGALSGDERHLTVAAAEALGRQGPAAASAAAALDRMAGLDREAPALRTVALLALTEVAPGQGVSRASMLATSPEWRLRAAAARALGAAGGLPGVILRTLVRDTDPRVADAALQGVLTAVGDSTGPVRPLLVESLGSADPMVRSTALRGLALAPDPSLMPLFLEAYARSASDTEHDAALAAIDALAALTRPGLEPSRPFLTRFERPDDPIVRARAVARLDSAAVIAAWGPVYPVETGLSPGDYRLLVERMVEPVLTGAAHPEAILVTRGDTVRIRLYASDAPLTVENFLRLADAGYFDGQQWPRVVPNFVVQGGDPRGDTSGGPGYSIRDEIGRHRYATGTVGMALAGPDTGGSQFFITHFPQPHLDGGYTIFGEVVAGAEVTRTILPGDTIESIRSAY